MELSESVHCFQEELECFFWWYIWMALDKLGDKGFVRGMWRKIVLIRLVEHLGANSQSVDGHLGGRMCTTG